MIGFSITRFGWNFNQRWYFGVQNPFVYQKIPNFQFKQEPAQEKPKWKIKLFKGVPL